MSFPPTLPSSASSTTLGEEEDTNMEKLPPLNETGSAQASLSDMDSSELDRMADLEKVISHVPTHHSRASKKSAATRTVTAQDWTGPDDPENPQNVSIPPQEYRGSTETEIASGRRGRRSTTCPFPAYFASLCRLIVYHQ
jgi:hypothetical protein